MSAYDTWATEPTPENLGKVLREMDPIVTQEVYRYAGPKPLLRARARVLTAAAVRSYDPTRGVPLGAHIRMQLKPLSRYGANLRPMKVSESLVSRAAELATHRDHLSRQLHRDPTDEELADFTGLSVDKVKLYQQQVPAYTSESRLVDPEGDEFLPEHGLTSHTSEAAEAVYQSLQPDDRKLYDWRTRQSKPLPVTEVAKRLKISPASVSQRSNSIAQRILEANENVLGNG